MLHIDKVYGLLLGYIDGVIAPKFKSLSQRAVIYSAVFLGAKKQDTILPMLKQQYLPMLGITDSNFNVDVALLEEWANYLLKKNNGEIEISKEVPFLGKVGYIADKEDVDNFITLLKEHEHGTHDNEERNVDERGTTVYDA